MIAALFVETGGVYFNRPNVDPYDINADAFTYRGPHPAVVHSPCAPWGRYWSGGPNPNAKRRAKGDDGGAFAHGLWVVRTFGGVMEHPEASWAWEWFGLRRPLPNGGWCFSDNFGGWTCQVEQGHYGHRARKKTWLYAVGCQLPRLNWEPSQGERLDEGFHSKAERDAARAAGVKPRPRLSTAENLATPPAFAQLLIDMAHSAAGRVAA